jgi:hypothetical protein
LKTDEANQQFQAKKTAKSQKEENAAKGRLLGMLAAELNDECGSDSGDDGDAQATFNFDVDNIDDDGCRKNSCQC